MAGNANCGGAIAFKLSEQELEKRIAEYKNGVESGIYPAPCPSDFYSFLGYSVEEMRELMAYRDVSSSAYNGRAKMAKKMLDWCKNQLVVHPTWSGKNLTKAIFMLKQDWGDGQRYADQDKASSGVTEVKVNFGGNDPRAKKASK